MIENYLIQVQNIQAAKNKYTAGLLIIPPCEQTNLASRIGRRAKSFFKNPLIKHSWGLFVHFKIKNQNV